MSALKIILAYQQAGWSIVPAALDRKQPLVSWRHWQRVAADPDQLARWQRRMPRCNWALVTGQLSGVVVVDIDPRHHGDHALAELEQRHGDLPWSAVVETPSGGVHVYLRHPGGRIPNSGSRVGLGVDVRGDNGLALLPPSHRPDGTYRWALGGPGSVPPMPAAWAELLRPPPRPTATAAGGGPGTARPAAGHHPARLDGLLRTVHQAPDHQRNSVYFWAACRLGEMLAAGAPPDWAEVLVRAGLEVGLEERECRDSLASGLGRQP